MENTPPSPSSIPPAAELIVHNGRQKGARRPLKTPVTIIGSAKGCDIRLSVKNVRQVHCLITFDNNGPQIRSWGGNGTKVNGTPVVTQLLRDGDVIGIGPFEFVVQWSVPLAESVEETPLPAQTAAPETKDSELKLLELQQQISTARAKFRREKSEFEIESALHLQQLADARHELECRETETLRDRAKIQHLRKRFIKRWKKQRSTQRLRLLAETDFRERERQRLDESRQALATERSAFRIHSDAETRRIEQAWEQIRSADKKSRLERARLQADLDQRQRAVADGEAQLKAEKEAFHAERMGLERHSAYLRIEADGLESRIVNLRAVLLQLEAQRALALPNDSIRDTLTDSKSSAEPAAVDLPADSRSLELERLAAELADQRLMLIEQFDRLATARENWREQEAQIVREMAELVEELRLREDRVIDREKAVAFEEDESEKERARLLQLRDHIDGWQARVEVRETAWKAESTRKTAELEQKFHQLERRERAVTELCHRWTVRRRDELFRLRGEYRRCEELRANWMQAQAAVEQQQNQVHANQREVAARALALEQAEQKFLNTSMHRNLAEKCLERMNRHVRRATDKARLDLEVRLHAVAAERSQFEELFRETAESLVRLAEKEREVLERSAQTEHLEAMITERARSFADWENLWKSQRQSFEREREELQLEIDRLSGLLLQNSNHDPAPLARAA
jgi:pSer/pThr/pTyr-binding forkhead associated (FHA) protein